MRGTKLDDLHTSLSNSSENQLPEKFDFVKILLALPRRITSNFSIKANIRTSFTRQRAAEASANWPTRPPIGT